MGDYFEDWPVLPDGVEAVVIHRLPRDPLPADDCFVCGEPMPPAEDMERCWGVPGRGVAHGGCYEPDL